MNQNILLNRIKENIIVNNLIEKGSGLVVGVSGGADSVCLLYALKFFQEEMCLNLTAVHVHHGLRGLEADQDKAFVEELCNKLEVKLETFQEDIKSIAENRNISLEEAGREVRYTIFSEILKKTGSKYIAVAHHRDDQAETIMLHILRGTGLDGLIGMNYKQGNIIRPLLNVSRNEIIRFLNENELNFRIDSSNLSNDYTRNKIRNQLFPMISDMFSLELKDQLIKLSDIVYDEKDYLDTAAQAAFNNAYIMDCESNSDLNPDLYKVELWADKLKNNHPALLKRIIRLAWEKLNKQRKNLELIHVNQIIDLLKNKSTGKRINLPNGIIVIMSYKRLIFLRSDEQPEKIKQDNKRYSYPIIYEGITYAKEAGGMLISKILPANEAFLLHDLKKIKEKDLVQLFDYDRIKSGITLRNRLDGDRIRPFASLGDKKLKDYFIDQKVPREKRSEIPLVALNNRIVWVIGMRTSDDFRAGEDTRTVWVLSWKDEFIGGEQTCQK